jgi:hypothetical protein
MSDSRLDDAADRIEGEWYASSTPARRRRVVKEFVGDEVQDRRVAEIVRLVRSVVEAPEEEETDAETSALPCADS